MAPPKRPWFRFYVEALTDPKLRRLSAEERWLWVVVLGLARQSPLPGWLLVTESIPMEPDDMSEMAGVTAARVQKGLSKMVELGLLVHDLDLGAYRVNKWDERQFESDDVAKRTSKHRSKNADTSTKERCNDVDVTPPESEAESETENSSSSSVTAGLTDPVLEEDEEILTRLVDLKFDARQQNQSLDPVIAPGPWKDAAKSDERRNHFVSRCDQAVLDHPEAPASAIARYLFDGTTPPKPPRHFTCEHCLTELVGLEEYQSHPDFCKGPAEVGATQEARR